MHFWHLVVLQGLRRQEEFGLKADLIPLHIAFCITISPGSVDHVSDHLLALGNPQVTLMAVFQESISEGHWDDYVVAFKQDAIFNR